MEVITSSFTEVLDEEERKAIFQDQDYIITLNYSQRLNSTSNFGSPHPEYIDLAPLDLESNRDESLLSRDKHFEETQRFTQGALVTGENDMSTLKEFGRFLRPETQEGDYDEEEVNAVFSSEEDTDLEETKLNILAQETKQAMIRKKENRRKPKVGVLDFNSFQKIVGSRNLKFDNSPFIHLTANPRYVDVLCVNCYECVRNLDVDLHSLVCQGNSGPASKNSPYQGEIPSFSTSKDGGESFNFELEVQTINDKIDKLAAALRIRLIEIEVGKGGATDEQILEDSNSEFSPSSSKSSDGSEERPQSLSDLYSSIYAYALKVIQNNDVSGT